MFSFSRYLGFSVIRTSAGCNQKWYGYHFSGIYHFGGRLLGKGLRRVSEHEFCQFGVLEAFMTGGCGRYSTAR